MSIPATFVEAERRIIDKGLNTTDWVVVGGLGNLKPGTHVTPRIEGEAPRAEPPENGRKD